MTLRDSLGTRNNALNFLRLLLAVLVIVSHTWSNGGASDVTQGARRLDLN